MGMGPDTTETTNVIDKDRGGHAPSFLVTALEWNIHRRAYNHGEDGNQSQDQRVRDKDAHKLR